MSKKTLFTAAVILLLSVHAQAELTTNEAHSLKMAQKFINGKDKSYYKPDGSIVFLHGGTLPSVLTAPLRTTDIELEPGEVIKDVQLGDTVRWVVSPALSGEGPTAVSHVIVKPTEENLQTNLAIFTDRRSYHINLKSTRTKYFPYVSFAYADQLSNQWAEYKKKTQRNAQAKTFTLPGKGSVVNIENLNFNYSISGSASWKPTRVYNDGIKTFIELPKSAAFKETPALLVLDEHNKEQLVNYRYQNNTYIVDKLFDQAALVLGVGSDQTKIIITKQRAKTAGLKSNLKILDEKRR
jgi:type IV secretion system protein VirB9